MKEQIPSTLRPEHPRKIAFSEVAKNFGLTVLGEDTEVTGVSMNTGDLRAGDLFVAMPGLKSHGANFYAKAIELGAAALITDRAGLTIIESAGHAPITYALLEEPRSQLGDIAAFVYGNHQDRPKLFATTGTNGKTSTSYLLEALLRQLGEVTGLTSTAERHIAGEVIVSRLTTPESTEMQALIARMKERGVTSAAIEVSAQALTQMRVDGLFFDVVGFTNLSHDHFDDYPDFATYIRAKAQLFTKRRASLGVVSLDSEFGSEFASLSEIPVVTITSRPEIAAQWRVDVTLESPEATEFELTGPNGEKLKSWIPLIGAHMAANAGLAIVMSYLAGFSWERLVAATAQGIDAYLPGRTERVSSSTGPAVYVDFGHSPDAFLNTLQSLRKVTKGRLFMVFGADGDRDASKRPEMARVAARNSDVVVVTDHHPRFEEPSSIRRLLFESAVAAVPEIEIYEVSPPEQAIRKAVSLAGPQDAILWAGPGHQDYRDIQGKRTPYSARAEARAALKEKWVSMIHLTLAEIAAEVGGEVLGNSAVVISGSVETDSRLVKPGSLFFAKPGEVTDGHNFVSKALEMGAVAAVVEHEVDVDIPQLVVGNSVRALGILAKAVLRRVRSGIDGAGIKVIGITGSNGKTTTKNMLREILSRSASTIAPIESYNNEVGAPISVLKITHETEYLIAELGAGGTGSIRYLAQITEPDVGVVLKVGMAHAGEFGGIETTASIKAELVEAIGEGKTLVLNRDDTYVSQMAAKSQADVVWFGTSPDADYFADNYQLTIEGTRFDLHWPDGEVSTLQLQILGEHHVMNALAASAVADQLQISRGQIIAALESMPLAERWRMQLLERADGLVVINDAYNASPDSTKAALQTLAQLGRLTGRRTVAVLGEMAELGEFSKTEHDAIGRLAVRMNLDQVVAVGAGAKLVHMGAAQEGSWDGESQYFETTEEALLALRGMVKNTDIVLVKSSKSANLRYLGDDLAEVN